MEPSSIIEFTRNQNNVGRNEKAAALIIRGRKVLLAREHGENLYKFPGGVPEPNEKIRDALDREVLEELDVPVVAAELYAKITSHYDGRVFGVYGYLTQIQREPRASHEIQDFIWVNSISSRYYNVTNSVKRFIRMLKKDRYIS